MRRKTWTPAIQRAKGRAHRAFDPLWLNAPRDQRRARREAAYVWLAAQLGKTRDATHIGRFDRRECALVVKLCRAESERRKAENRKPRPTKDDPR